MANKKLTDIISTRANSFKYFTSVLGYLPDPDPILRKTGNDITVYKDVMLDPHVYSVSEQRRAQTTSLEYEINRGKSKNRNVRLIEDLFEDDDFNLYEIIGQMLDAIFYGYKPFEIEWQKVGRFIVPVKVEDRPPEWFTFGINNELRFKSKTAPIKGEELPDKKFLLAQYKPTYDNPFGERVLSRCFWPVAFKKASDKWWVTFLEKYGMVHAIGKLPRNQMGDGSNEVTKLLEMLENMVQDALAVIPDDASVELKEPPGKGVSAQMFEKRMMFSNTEISKAVLTQTLTTELQGSTGSRAAGSVHADQLTKLGQSDKKIVTRELNKLIRWIYELNFNDSEVPTIEMFEEEQVDSKLAERDAVLKDKVGVKFTKSYIQENYNLSDADFDMEEKPDTTGNPIDPPQPPLTKPPIKIEEPGGDIEMSEEKSFWKKLKSLFFASDKKEAAEEQELINRMVEDIPVEILQMQMETVLKPVIDSVKKGDDYETVITQLAEVYPDMKTDQVEKLLQKMIFLSETIGRLSVEQED